MINFYFYLMGWADDEALAHVREPWEPETTARNLRLIREAREQRGETIAWAKNIEDTLTRRATV